MKHQSTKDLVSIALAIALIAVGAFIRIMSPYGVPFTLQPLMVMLCSLILRRYRATVAVLLYLLIGLLGIPIFALGGGPAYVFQPSFAYLLAFIPMSLVISFTKSHLPGPQWVRIAVACLLGELVLYGLALPYVGFLMRWVLHKDYSLTRLIQVFCLLYLPTDLVQGVLAGILALRLRRLSE